MWLLGIPLALLLTQVGGHYFSCEDKAHAQKGAALDSCCVTTAWGMNLLCFAFMAPQVVVAPGLPCCLLPHFLPNKLTFIFSGVGFT